MRRGRRAVQHARREELHRRGLRLEWFTVAWNVGTGPQQLGVLHNIARGEAQAALTTPCNRRSDNAPRLRFSATVGEELEVELALV